MKISSINDVQVQKISLLVKYEIKTKKSVSFLHFKNLILLKTVHDCKKYIKNFVKYLQ